MKYKTIIFHKKTLLNMLNIVPESSLYSILETDLSQITKNIFLGDRRTATNHQLLKQLGIKKIVVAGAELAPHYPNQFAYLHLQVKDSLKEDLSLHFDRVCDFIDEGILNDEGVFVHCAFGVSRSPTLVIAFLMKKLKIGYREAYGLVRRKRPEIKPNPAFEQQLKSWEASIKKKK